MNLIALGDCEDILGKLEREAVQLILTSPPYYSFVGDIVLDPFAGVRTTGKAAVKLGREFWLIEREPYFVDTIRRRAKDWLGKDAALIKPINVTPIDIWDILL